MPRTELNIHEYTDRELLALRGTQDFELAFAELVRRHARTIEFSCRTVLVEHALVQDAVQATFVILFKQSRLTLRADSLSGWLSRVAYRESLRIAKSYHRHRQASPLGPNEEALPGSAKDSPLTSLLQKETQHILLEELHQLPTKYVELLALFHFEGNSRQSIAKRVGCSETAVKSALQRGRQLLAKRLIRRGVCLPVGVIIGTASSQLPRLVTGSTALELVKASSWSLTSLTTAAKSLNWLPRIIPQAIMSQGTVMTSTVGSFVIAISIGLGVVVSGLGLSSGKAGLHDSLLLIPSSVHQESAQHATIQSSDPKKAGARVGSIERTSILGQQTQPVVYQDVEQQRHAMDLFEQGEYQKSIETINELLRERPNMAMYFYMRARCHGALGQLDRAIDDYTSAIELQPDYENSWLGRGLTHNELGDLAAAIMDFRSLADLQGDQQSLALMHLTWNYAKLEQFEEALAMSTNALELAPNNAQLHRIRSTILEALGRHDEAEQSRQMATVLAPMVDQVESEAIDMSELLDLTRYHSDEQLETNQAVQEQLDEANRWEPDEDYRRIAPLFRRQEASSNVDLLASIESIWREGNPGEFHAAARASVYLGQQAQRNGQHEVAAKIGLNAFLCSAHHLVRLEALRLLCSSGEPETAMHWLELIENGRQDSYFQPALPELKRAVEARARER